MPVYFDPAKPSEHNNPTPQLRIQSTGPLAFDPSRLPIDPSRLPTTTRLPRTRFITVLGMIRKKSAKANIGRAHSQRSWWEANNKRVRVGGGARGARCRHLGPGIRYRCGPRPEHRFFCLSSPCIASPLGSTLKYSRLSENVADVGSRNLPQMGQGSGPSQSEAIVASRCHSEWLFFEGAYCPTVWLARGSAAAGLPPFLRRTSVKRCCDREVLSLMVVVILQDMQDSQVLLSAI